MRNYVSVAIGVSSSFVALYVYAIQVTEVKKSNIRNMFSPKIWHINIPFFVVLI